MKRIVYPLLLFLALTCIGLAAGKPVVDSIMVIIQQGGTSVPTTFQVGETVTVILASGTLTAVIVRIAHRGGVGIKPQGKGTIVVNKRSLRKKKGD